MKLVPRRNPVARRWAPMGAPRPGRARKAAIDAFSRAISRLRQLEMPAPGGSGRGLVYILAVIAAGIAAIGLRAPAVHAAPALAAVYEAIGLPVNLTGLALRDVRARSVRDGSRRVLVTEGEIVNIRREDNDVPSLALSVRGADGVQRYGWIAPAPKNRLAPGEVITFRARLAAPPEDGVEVVVGFASGEASAADRLDLGDLRSTTDDGRVTGRDIPNPAKMP